MEYTKACVICGISFVSKSHNALVCSVACKKKYRVIWNRQDREKKPKKIRYSNCPICKKSVILNPKSTAFCCSNSCREIANKQRFKRYKETERGKAKEKEYRNSEQRKQWILDNKGRLKKRAKLKRLENKDHINARRRERYHNNIEFRLRISLGGYLQRMVTHKKKNTLSYVGYSLRELKEHLQLLFKEGMYWDNYGKWHIDHIRPLCSFQFVNDDGAENIEEIKKAMSLDNLQPLWAHDNISKGGKYPHMEEAE